MDTIFALSSGSPPAGIAVVRVSGPAAGAALEALVGRLPPPRRAVSARLHDAEGAVLDHAMVLWLPGPGTATGEDTAELHLHGGRAVVAAVEAALERQPAVRRAQAGEFTRRAFANGRIDLAEAEGLADLLSAETELQRRAAMAMAGGALSRTVGNWRDRVLMLSAQVEAVLDFDDEDDVGGLPANFPVCLAELVAELREWLSRPRGEPLRNGFRVCLAGPPNAGKSSLFNVLVGSEAAITASSPGTTRDLIERSVALDGVPFTFIDTAGLRAITADPVEEIGIARAEAALAEADLVLWLGKPEVAPEGAWIVASQSDVVSAAMGTRRHAVSSVTLEGISALLDDLVRHARTCLPKPGEVALNARQHRLVTDAVTALDFSSGDPLILAEQLRSARSAFDSLVGRASTEDMLDTLFGHFCIGK